MTGHKTMWHSSRN